ncbi:MaoC family dehydratase [Rummeliibacillus pycnus]|uniref:MaoC family dehydratase n=1 Tax=Rummeliibacillus pycnus TaxID=101070 RepID=UPI003D295F8D
MKKFITTEEIHHYAKVSKDNASIHIDQSAAHQAGFERPIVHGMYLMGLAQSLYLKTHPNQWIQQYEMRFQQSLLVDQEVDFHFEIQGNNVQIHLSTFNQKNIALGTFYVKEWNS